MKANISLFYSFSLPLYFPSPSLSLSIPSFAPSFTPFYHHPFLPSSVHFSLQFCLSPFLSLSLSVSFPFCLSPCMSIFLSPSSLPSSLPSSFAYHLHFSLFLSPLPPSHNPIIHKIQNLLYKAYEPINPIIYITQ